MQDGNILQYVTGPIQLIGLIILVVAALVPKLTHTRDAKNRRALIWGLLGLGTLGVLGGIGLEVAKLHAATAASSAPTRPDIQVNGNRVGGKHNTLGVGNSIAGSAKAVGDTGNVSVNGNTITGNGNAVGVGNAANTPKSSSQ